MSTNDDAVKQIDLVLAQMVEAQQTLEDVRAALTLPVPPPQPQVILVPAGANLQTAITVARAGDTLLLEDATYSGAIVLEKRVTIAAAHEPRAGRIDPTAPHPTIVATADATVKIRNTDLVLATILRGVEVNNLNADGTLIEHTGTGCILDRVIGLGTPGKGQHRGVLANGAQMAILDSHFDHIFAFNRESSVIGGYDGLADLRIDNSFLCGGSSTIMIGGADSSSASRMPTRIGITHSELTWRPEWYDLRDATGARPWRKNIFEVKAGTHGYLADCVGNYAGTSQGQAAYAIVVNVRNQGSHAPWSTVQDWLFERCAFGYAGGCVNLLGLEDRPDPAVPGTLLPSVLMDGVTFKNVLFHHIDPRGLSAMGALGAKRGFLFQRGPKNVTLDSVTIEAVGMDALGYFGAAGKTPPHEPINLTLRNLKFDRAAYTYDWKIDAGSQGLGALQAYLASRNLTMDRVGTADATGASGYPTP